MLILTDKTTEKMILDLKSVGPLLSMMGKNAFIYELSNFQSMEFFIEAGKTEILYNNKPLSLCESVYMKRVGRYTPESTLIARFLEKRSIPFVDTYHTYGSTNGKLAQMFVLAESDIPVPKTYFSPIYDREKLLRAANFLGYPIVAKKIFSSRGRGVFLINTQDELLFLLNTPDHGKLILQEYIPNESDFRIFITGTIVGALEERVRQNKKDFRNNASLGGKEIYSDPKKIPAPLKRMALAAAKVLRIEVAGVDIVVSSENKKMYLFEVNKSPGFTPEDPKSTEIVSLFNYLCQIKKSSSTSRKKK
jgi:RimK family alpha-L-glutamate ligase